MKIVIEVDLDKALPGSNEQPKKDWTVAHHDRPDKYRATPFDVFMNELISTIENWGGVEDVAGPIEAHWYDGRAVIGKIEVTP